MGRQGFQEGSKGSISVQCANVRTPTDLLGCWEQKRGFSTSFVRSFARIWDFYQICQCRNFRAIAISD